MGAAAAAAAHVSGASPAAAAAGDPLVLGRSNTSNRGTQLSSTDIDTAVEIVSTEGARETVAVTNRGLPANPLLPNLGSALYAYHATDGQGVSAASARGAAVRLGRGALRPSMKAAAGHESDWILQRDYF